MPPWESDGLVCCDPLLAPKSMGRLTLGFPPPATLKFHASSGCTIPAVLANQLGASTDSPVAAAVAPTTPVQATGPSGVQPKKWLTPGVWTIATSTAELPSAVATTSGLCRRVSSVCASCVITRAVNPIVEVRLSVPGVQRPIPHAAVAPAAVTAPRVTI